MTDTNSGCVFTRTSQPAEIAQMPLGTAWASDARAGARGNPQLLTHPHKRLCEEGPHRDNLSISHGFPADCCRVLGAGKDGRASHFSLLKGHIRLSRGHIHLGSRSRNFHLPASPLRSGSKHMPSKLSRVRPFGKEIEADEQPLSWAGRMPAHGRTGMRASDSRHICPLRGPTLP